MKWHTLSDGSLRSDCGRFDILNAYRGTWVLVDAEAGTVQRYDRSALAVLAATVRKNAKAKKVATC